MVGVAKIAHNNGVSAKLTSCQKINESSAENAEKAK